MKYQIVDYESIGQQCVMDTKAGKRCKLPASTIAGGLAACPYHITKAVSSFRKVDFAGYKNVKQSAIRDSKFF